MSSTLREASKDTLQAENKTYHYYSLPLAAKELGDIARLPKSLKVLLENLLRWQDDDSVTEEDIRALAGWLKTAHADREIAYRPARVLMQDFTGVPAVVDLAAMREAVKRLGGDTAKVNPLSPLISLSTTPSLSIILVMTTLSKRTFALKWNVITSAMFSCAGDSRRSAVLASYRREPEFATRSIWNIWAKRYGANYRTKSGWLIRTPWWEPTRIPR
jgi:hypothetical protein